MWNIAANTETRSNQDSLWTKVRIWYYGLPLCTRTTLTLIVAVYLFDLVTGLDSPVTWCLNPHYIVHDFQVYRFLSSVVIHGGILHVAFNMLAFAPLGTSMERESGSLQFGYLLLVLTLGEGILYIALAYILYFSMLYPEIMGQCAVGFSGVIFGLVVIDNAASSATQRSVFGLFYVPAPAFPWLLLIICQIMLPSASLLGHLAGILVGQLWVWGVLQPLRLSRHSVLRLENSRWLSYLTRSSSFIPSPPDLSWEPSREQSSSRSQLFDFGPTFRSFSSLFRWNQHAASHPGSDPEVPVSSLPAPIKGESTFAGNGRVLGGSSTLVAMPPLNAAAAAAEARASKVTSTDRQGGAQKNHQQGGMV